MDPDMMDDDLFADLYGDDDATTKPSESTTSKPKEEEQPKATESTIKPAHASESEQTSAAPTDGSSEPKAEAHDDEYDPNAPQDDQHQQSDQLDQQDGTQQYDGQGQEWNQEDQYHPGGGNDGNHYQQQQQQQHQQNGQGYHQGGGGGSAILKEDGKMFIGGLNWETTDESLKEYFTQFGEVLECTVMRDGPTGRSRGFGFLTFKDPQTVNIVMDQEHFLDGKIIDPKRAIPRDEQEKTSKIFVGGISQECTESDFKEYFQQFGRVLDSTLMIDKDTGRPRGFGFVTFDNEQAVENALNHPDLQIHGKAIEVKKAQPRGNMRGQHFEEDSSKFRQARLQAEQAQQQNQMQMPAFPNAAGYPMSPAMMATYWQKMQQYMLAMQRSGVPPMAMMPGMAPNPMMAAQMQMQMAAMAGAGRGMQPGMPQAPPPMPQGPPPFGATDFGGMGRGNQQQQFYEANHQRIPPHQRDFQHQQQAQGGQTGAQANWNQGGDGMYDGAMQQGQPPSAQGIASPTQQPAQQQGPAAGQAQAAPSQPQNQRQSLTPGPRPGEGPPPNAPTGPRNIRGPATNFRGAGRGIGMAGRAGFAGRGNMGSHVGYHPYARNG